MAEIKLPDIRPAKTIEEKLDALYDAYYMMRKWLNYAFSGVLDAENVKEAAAVKRLTAEQINVLDGIILGANATINWGELPSLPTPAQIGARPDTWMPSADDVGAISSTYIDENGVFTPQVYATNINVLRGKITTAQIEDLVVGGNVTMGPNARISWSQVTGAPSIPTLPGYIKSTYIDATTVQSPTIVGGTISGMYIYGSEFHGEGANSAYIKVGSSSGLGDIRLYRGGTSTPVFWIYDGIDGISFMSNLGNGSQTAFLMSRGTATYAYGTWNFSGATVTGLSAVAVFG
jgi:hypothetical protein